MLHPTSSESSASSSVSRLSQSKPSFTSRSSEAASAPTVWKKNNCVAAGHPPLIPVLPIRNVVDGKARRLLFLRVSYGWL